MYEIEKGIPLVSIRHMQTKYPCHDMEVGDSILLPKNYTAYSVAYFYSKNGKRFAARAVEGGVRVWRVK